MQIQPGDTCVCLDHYGREKIARVPPVTFDKMQGQEAEIAVVVLGPRNIGARGLYTACSRGKVRCFVVADMDATPANERRCPSRDFVDAVMTSKGVVPKTEFFARFPAYDAALAARIAVDPEACVYYVKKKKKGAEEEEPAAKKKKVKKKRSDADD